MAEILQQIGHALEQTHQHGLVHRDLKLENIFLCASRRRDVAFTAKVLDFDIAKLVAENHHTGVVYRVTNAGRGRVKQRVMSPLECLARLAPRHPWRARVVPRPPRVAGRMRHVVVSRIERP